MKRGISANAYSLFEDFVRAWLLWLWLTLKEGLLMHVYKVTFNYSSLCRSANQPDADNSNKLYLFFILAVTVLRQTFINSGYKGRETQGFNCWVSEMPDFWARYCHKASFTDNSWSEMVEVINNGCFFLKNFLLLSVRRQACCLCGCEIDCLTFLGKRVNPYPALRWVQELLGWTPVQSSWTSPRSHL